MLHLLNGPITVPRFTIALYFPPVSALSRPLFGRPPLCDMLTMQREGHLRRAFIAGKRLSRIKLVGTVLLLTALSLFESISF